MVFSDNGECIDRIIERIDSERIAELVREQLELLPDKQYRMLIAYYGECFYQRKMSVTDLALLDGVKRQTIYLRIEKAKRFILRPGTRLMKYLHKDEMYSLLFQSSKLHYQKKKKPKLKRKPVQKASCIVLINNQLIDVARRDPSLKHFYDVLKREKSKKVRKL